MMRRRLACGCSKSSLGPSTGGLPTASAAAAQAQYLRRFYPQEAPKSYPGFRVFGALTAPATGRLRY